MIDAEGEQAGILKTEEALDMARRGRDIVAATYGDDSKKVLLFDAVLITALGRSGDVAEADAHLAGIVPHLGKLDPRKRALADVHIGRHQGLAGRHEEGERTLMSAHQTLVDLHDGRHFETRRAVAALIQLYDRWSAAGSATAGAKADRWRRR